MSEDEYLCATNRTKVSAALGIIRDILPGPKYGITESEHKNIMILLRDTELKMFASFEIVEEIS